MSRISSFILGVVIGGAVGATAAILLAPSSGENLRSTIVTRAEQIRADIMHAAAERRAELERQLAALREPKTSA
jgi:gas vesicle protein